jgi:ribonucleoside-triphosphate reductase
LENWDCYVGVSFLYRNDPTKNAEDLGYAYLPQEVVTKEAFEAYASKLKDIDYAGIEIRNEEPSDAACANGVCPIR